MEQKGELVNMCSALEELEKMAEQRGVEKGIQVTIKTCKNLNIDKDVISENLKKEFSLSDEDVEKYMQLYW